MCVCVYIYIYVYMYVKACRSVFMGNSSILININQMIFFGLRALALR